jgi:site-specific recombinase XerD
MARSSHGPQKRPIEVLTGAEVSRLLRQCSATAPTGIRNRALITVLYRAGLRVEEALALRAADVDPANGTVRVLHGKGDKARTSWIDDGSMALVQRWIDKRAGLGFRHGPLFCTLKGGQMSTAYVRALMTRLGRDAGIEKRVHAHGLRHSYSAKLAESGVPANVIQVLLGHEHLSTTDTYLRHVMPADAIAIVRDKVPAWDLEEK